MRKESALNQSSEEMQSLFLLEEHRLRTQARLHTGVYGESRGQVGSRRRRHARKAAASPGFTSAGCLRGEGAGSPARRASTPRVQSRPGSPRRCGCRSDRTQSWGRTQTRGGLPPPPTAATASVCPPQSPPERTAAPRGSTGTCLRGQGSSLHLGAGHTGRGPSAGREPLSREAGGLASPAINTHAAKEQLHHQPCSP